MKTQEEILDMQKVMETYKELAKPGQRHMFLASMTGSWSAKVKTWVEPDKPPVESTGTCERKMLLGGRYLQEEFSGEMMGSPFNGIGLTGYSNQTQKYVSVWLDTLSTGIFYFEGNAGADGRSFILESRFEDPVKGPVTFRSVTRLVDNNTLFFEMRGTDKHGKEEKTEITYTRKPGTR